MDAALIFLPVLYFANKKKNFVKELGVFSNGVKKDLKNTIVLIFTLIIFSILVSFITGLFGLNDLEKVSQNIQEIKATAPLLIWYFLTVRVAAEEIFFRGFLVNRIGIFGSSAFFGLAHFSYGSYVEVFGAFVLGLVLAKAFEENQNLIPNIAAHFFYNLVFLTVFL